MLGKLACGVQIALYIVVNLSAFKKSLKIISEKTLIAKLIFAAKRQYIKLDYSISVNIKKVIYS